MRRSIGRRTIGVSVGLAVLALAATALAGGSATVRSGQVAGLGKVVTTSSGLTLYHYTDEHRGVIDCKGACATLWPPLLVKGSAKPTAGAGLTAAKLGTIRRPDGRLQLTYNGLALYRYAPDRKAGDAKGQGVGHAWYAIAPTGRIVTRTTTPAAPPASTPPPTEMPPGSGYGYG
jgi:predicted lipoprotein with Yx(FWY)xxD motif